MGGNTMIYVYIKGGANKQKVEQERSDIYSYIIANKIAVNEWIEESIIGLFCPKRSNLKGLIKKTEKRDFVICSELINLGNSFLRIYTTLLYLIIHGVKVYSVRDKRLIRPSFIGGLLAFTYCINSLIKKSKNDKRNIRISKQRLEEYHKLKVHCSVLGKGGIRHRTHKVVFDCEQTSENISFINSNG